MGCGKTIQGIAFATHYRDEWPLLILTPAGVRANWRKELLRFLPESVLDESEIRVVTKLADPLDDCPCI
eukprot:9227291-Prorocentrum_lima.AAC.1